MSFPNATRKTAFFAGVSLAIPFSVLMILKFSTSSQYSVESPEVVSFFMIYLLLSVSLYVLDVRSFAPKQLKTRFPMLYFPTNQEGVDFLFRGLGRILLWLLGVFVGACWLTPLWYFLAKS